MAKELVTVKRKCNWCKQEYSFDVPLDGMQKWEAGHLIQSAFPEMSGPVREQLLSGTHPHCWDEMWCDQGEDCYVHEGLCPPRFYHKKYATKEEGQ